MGVLVLYPLKGRKSSRKAYAGTIIFYQVILICLKLSPLLNVYMQYTQSLVIINQLMDRGIANKHADQIPL